MGEALITRRAGGAEVAEGFPAAGSNRTTWTIPDLIRCNGFFISCLGSVDDFGGTNGALLSVYYDGNEVSAYRMRSPVGSSSMYLTSVTVSFDPATGTISNDNYNFTADWIYQCVYW